MDLNEIILKQKLLECGKEMIAGVVTWCFHKCWVCKPMKRSREEGPTDKRLCNIMKEYEGDDRLIKGKECKGKGIVRLLA